MKTNKEIMMNRYFETIVMFCNSFNGGAVKYIKSKTLDNYKELIFTLLGLKEILRQAKSNGFCYTLKTDSETGFFKSVFIADCESKLYEKYNLLERGCNDVNDD